MSKNWNFLYKNAKMLSWATRSCHDCRLRWWE